MAARFSPFGSRRDLSARPGCSGAQYSSYEFQSNNGIFVTRSDEAGLAAAGCRRFSCFTQGQPSLPETIPSGCDTFAKLPDGRPNPNHRDLYVTWTRAYPAVNFPATANPQSARTSCSPSLRWGPTWQTRTRPQGGSTAIRHPGCRTTTAVWPRQRLRHFSSCERRSSGDLYVSLKCRRRLPGLYSTDQD